MNRTLPEFPETLRTETPSVMRAPVTVRTMTTDVLIALAPALIWGVYVYGFRVLTLAAAAILGAVLTELAAELILRRPAAVGDLTAAVSGLIFAMTLPQGAPLWLALAGGAAASLLKQAFGGVGRNLVNPALTVRALTLLLPGALLTVTAPFTKADALAMSVVLPAASAPSEALASGVLPNEPLLDLLIGNAAGSVGCISVLMLLAGGVYLSVRRVIDWRIPGGFLAALAVLAFCFPVTGDAFDELLYALLTDGAVFAAFFAATDPVTSPLTENGHLLCGLLGGALTFLLRRYGVVSGSAWIAVPVVGLLSRPIDFLLAGSPLGGKKR